jgi:hypothetical protein
MHQKPVDAMATKPLLDVVGGLRATRSAVEIGHVLRPTAQRCQLAAAYHYRVGDEHQVELAAFGRLRDLGVVPEN